MLDTDGMLDIADQIADLGCELTVLAGGEPLVRDDWQRIATRLLDRGVLVSLVTNGTRFTKKTARWCVDAGIHSVHVSLDGAKELHNRQRNDPTSHDKALKAIRAARSQDMIVVAVTTITKLVMEDLEELGSTLAEEGVENWQVRLAASQRGNRLTQLDYVEPEALPEVVQRLCDLAGRPGWPTIQAATSLGYYGTVETELRGAYQDDAWQGCTCGLDWCYLEPNGDLKACGNTHVVEGNVRELCLSELWADPERFRDTRTWSLAKLGGGCRQCDWAARCRGGCLAIAETRDGLREVQHCMQHPATGGPRNLRGFWARRAAKKLRTLVE